MVEPKITDNQAVQAITAALMWFPQDPFTINGDIEAAAERAWAAVSDLINQPPPRECVACGCTDAHACLGGCSWVGPNICSRCADDPLVGFKPFTSPDAVAIATLAVLAPVIGATAVAVHVVRRRRRVATS